MPDGTLNGELSRVVAVYAAQGACCPRCGGGLGVSTGEGVVMLACKIRNRDRNRACDQRVLVIGFQGRLCLVVPVTTAEFREFQSQELEPKVLLTKLRILGVPLMPAA